MSEIATRTPQQQLIAEVRSESSLAQVAAALEGTGISPTKFVRVAVTAINENAQLVDADRASLFGSLMRCAQDGLLPDGREAALVLFGKKATYMPMVGGLRKIAAEYGWSIIAYVVHENDAFDPDIETARANYRPARLGTDPGDAQGAYAVGEHRDGRRLLEVMTLQEIEAVRATSRAKDKGPWVEWWGEMARKTVVRRLFKSLPLDPKDRERIERVLNATDLDTGARVDLLYGKEPSPAAGGERTPPPEETPPQSSPAPVSDQQASGSTTAGPEAPGPDVIDGEATEIPFEGEEPTFDPEPPADEEVVFTAGKFNGKTLAEVYASGKDGQQYVRWAYSAWKPDQEPMRSALNRFADAHADVKP